MNRRRRIPAEIETAVLIASARRCAVCYGIDSDFAEKERGQIAHLSKDPSRIDEDDLIYLCLNHHDRYDSRTSQSKGLTAGELREYRARLYKAVETSRVATQPTPADVRAIEPQGPAVTAPITAEWADGTVDGWTRANMQLDIYANTDGPITITDLRFSYWPVGAKALKRDRGPGRWAPELMGQGHEREAGTIEFPLDWIPESRRGGQQDAQGLVEVYAEVKYSDESTGQEGTVAAGPIRVAKIPPMPREARRLLVEAAKDRGTLYRIPAGLGESTVTFQANGQTFGTYGDPRSEAIWEEACERLEAFDLVRGRGGKREVFQVTAAGYRIADALRGEVER